MKKITTALIFSLIIFSFGCEDDGSDSNVDTTNPEKKVKIAFETAKQIFYSLPSPVETAMIIENTNVQFSDEFILPYEAVDLYETSDEQAVNLGVYSADLSYLTMFGQQQIAVKYLAACKKLAEELSLLNVISDSTINELQNNIMDKDQAMNIISEQFININSYLEENDRSISATLIVFGGWVEGLYLSVMLIGNDVEDNIDLAQMIYDQKISLEDLINLLDLYKEDEHIKTYLYELKELKTIYDSMSPEIK